MSEYRVTGLVGTATDYADEGMWAHLPAHADKEVDTFFIYPTVFIDPRPGAPAIAEIDNPVMRQGVADNYGQAPMLFEDLTNLYEPYYRQSNLCALSGKTSAEVLAFQMQEQRTDIYAALDYFFAHYNQGRPFILAGHSQGSIMLKIALRDYFLEHVDYLERMVAAYALGFSITGDDLEANPALRFAEGADDTGVIVSWNTEGPENRSARNPVVLEGAMAINPLNWRRDETHAPASANLGDRVPVFGAGDGALFSPVGFETHRPGLADAQLDLERGVVVCTTTPERYIRVPTEVSANGFGPASLHIADYAGYWDNIRENVQTRIRSYFAKAR
jgi:hypothetical protein